MKIAFIVSEFPSVSQTFILSQIVGVIERGHEVTIFAGHARPDVSINQELSKFHLLEHTIYPQIPQNKILRLWKGLNYFARFILKNPVAILKSLNFFRYEIKAASLSLLFQIIPFLEHNAYDIIHCQFGDLGFEGLRIKQIVGGNVKLVTSFRGYDATKKKYRHSVCYKELFEGGDLFLPVSHSLKARIIEQGCHEAKIVVLASGIDSKKFQYSTRNVFQNKPINVITIGRLVEKKGISYALEAVARVVESGRCVNYVVVGEGELRGDLEKLIGELGLESHVQLLGRKSHGEVICLLQDAHILVLPSVTANDGDQEGIPNVLKEAMAMGLPIISTWHSGIPELVEDGVSGFLVEERNVDALADRLMYLIDHPSVWSQMGKAGRQCVEKFYDCNKLNDQLVALYSNLLVNEPNRVECTKSKE